MRQIDNMTPQEIETLHLKGMLADNKAKPVLSAMLDASESFADPAPNKAQPQHSPLPWKWYVNYHCPGKLKGAYVDSTTARVADVRSLGVSLDGEGSQEICESNAKLIVRAVNHADRLAECLERCRDLVIAYRKAYCTSLSYDSDAAIKEAYQVLQDFGVPNAQKGGQQ